MSSSSPSRRCRWARSTLAPSRRPSPLQARAIFSSLFGADLAKFVREGQTRGLFKGVEVFNLLAGEPEYLDPLKEEAPEGWYVTLSLERIKTPEHTGSSPPQTKFRTTRGWVGGGLFTS